MVSRGPASITAGIALFLAAACYGGQIVEGTVSNSVSGVGIPGAEITLTKTGKSYKAAADARGHFRIEDVTEGEYSASFAASGFVGPYLGQQQSRPVRVDASSAKLDQSLDPAARLSGHVLDAGGKPVRGAAITLSDAQMTVAIEHNTAADGSYEFRNVSPGNYFLDAQPPPSIEAPPPVAGETRGWIRTWFPNGGDKLSAARLNVGAGWDVGSQDIRLLAVPHHRLRGIVLDVNGEPAANARLKLVHDSAWNVREVVFKSEADGQFESPPLPDGGWRLSTQGADGTKTVRAFRWIDVAGHDIDRIQLRMERSFALPVSIEFPGKPEDEACVVLAPFEGGSGDEIVQGCGHAKEFILSNLFARRYRITPFPKGDNSYLASITQGARDVMGQAIELHEGALPLRIVFKQGGGAIHGSVEKCGEATVIAMPQEEGLRANPAYRLTRRTSCDANGNFQLSNMRPGGYYVFAFDRNTLSPGEFAALDQDLLNRAVSVNVATEQIESVELRVTSRTR